MKRFCRKIYALLFSIFQNRQLLIMLSVKDFKRRFAGSYFGTVWAFVQPLLTILIYLFVFQIAFQNGNVDNVPFVLWFMCGIVPWLFISEAISSASNALLEYGYLVKKVVFNIDILPLVKVLSAGYIHLFFIALLLIVSCMFGYWPTLYFLQLVYYLFCAVMFVFAFTLFTSAIIVFFRDLNQIIGIILLIGMWGTPIAWNIKIFPEQSWFFIKLNPLFYIVEGYRDSVIGGIWFWQKYNQTLYFWLLTLMLTAFGAVIFNRLKPHFSDIL